MRKRLLAALLASTLAGCSFLQTGFQQPAPALPDAWPAVAGQPASLAEARWWTLFRDQTLDALVEEALQHNHDIAIGAARVLEAEARLGVTDAQRYPVVTANGGGNRTGISEATDTPMFSGMPRYQNNYRATLDASYEVDVWGKYRRASDAARAELLAAQAAQDTVKVTLAAEVAQQYFNLMAGDAQLAVLAEELQTRNETLDLLRLRQREGLTSNYEVRLAEAEVAAVEGQRAVVRRSQDTLESTLLLLLGRSPREVMQGGVDRAPGGMEQPLWVPDGLPSELLLRRPDIREAEQKLLAEDARIAVARAEFFPSISLTAYLGSESATLGKLFSGPAGIFQFALGLGQPIFNAGRLSFSLKAAEARREQAIAGYQRSVAAAFGDVRNALTAQTMAREALQAESQRVGALREALRLANLRYEGGLSSRLEVLDADRQLLLAQMARINAENTQRAAIVSLFRALGGGWQAPE